MNDLQDVVNEFLVESYENLDQLDRDLVTLEQTPASEPVLSSIFRTIHTIKGTCGFLGFGRLESVAHVGEVRRKPRTETRPWRSSSKAASISC